MAKVRLGFYIVQQAKRRYVWGFNLSKNAKITYGWDLILLKMRV